VFKKFSFKEKFNYQNIYPTTHDAIISVLRKRKLEQPLSKKKYSIHIHTEDTSSAGGLNIRTINTNSDAGDISSSSNTNSVRRDSKQVRFLNRRQSNVFDEMVLSGIKISEEKDSKHLSNITEESSV